MGNQPSHPPMEVPPDLEAVYSNVVRISHTPAELVFDFARILPGSQVMRLYARVIMSPVGAKLFARALSDNLARYEAAFGEIPLPGEGSLASDLFRSIHPPDNPTGS